MFTIAVSISTHTTVTKATTGAKVSTLEYTSLSGIIKDSSFSGKLDQASCSGHCTVRIQRGLS